MASARCAVSSGASSSASEKAEARQVEREGGPARRKDVLQRRHDFGRARGGVQHDQRGAVAMAHVVQVLARDLDKSVQHRPSVPIELIFSLDAR